MLHVGIIAGHGVQSDGSVQLAVSQGIEYLTIQDIYVALQALPIHSGLNQH